MPTVLISNAWRKTPRNSQVSVRAETFAWRKRCRAVGELHPDNFQRDELVISMWVSAFPFLGDKCPCISCLGALQMKVSSGAAGFGVQAPEKVPPAEALPQTWTFRTQNCSRRGKSHSRPFPFQIPSLLPTSLPFARGLSTKPSLATPSGENPTGKYC